MRRALAIVIFVCGCDDRTNAPVVATSYDPALPAEDPAGHVPIDCPPGTSAVGDVPGATDARVSVAGVNRQIWCSRPDGVKHGPSVTWDPNGNRLASETFTNGLLDGRRVELYANGEKRREETYRLGARHGPCKTWDSTGTLTLEATYVDDALHGPYFATELAEPELVAAFRGQSVTRVEGEYEKGELHGTWEVWAPLRERSEWSAGVRHGKVELWYENGQLAVAGEFERGKRHGRWREWTMDGDLLEEGSYRKGFKHGKWRELHGGRLESGRYEGGKRVGPWVDRVGDTLIEKLLREKLGDHPIFQQLR